MQLTPRYVGPSVEVAPWSDTEPPWFAYLEQAPATKICVRSANIEEKGAARCGPAVAGFVGSGDSHQRTSVNAFPGFVKGYL